mgnify:CR=1 FL=1
MAFAQTALAVGGLVSDLRVTRLIQRESASILLGLGTAPA